MAQQASRWEFVAWMVLAAASWGFGTVAVKRGLSDLQPLTLGIIALGTSTILLWAIVLIQHIPMRLNAGALRIGLIGLLSPGISFTLGVFGVRLTSASLVSLIQATEPVAIIGLAWLILHQRPSRSLVVLSALAIVGVCLVAGVDLSASEGNSLIGTGLIFAATLCSALQIVLSGRMVITLDPRALVTLQQTAGFVWLLAIWPIEMLQAQESSASLINLSGWAWAAIHGISFWALGYLFYFRGVRKASPSLAAPFLSLIPVFGISVAFVLLGERLQATQWIGAILILVAMTSIARLSRPETHPAE